jgi:CRISPR-associated endonuclease/helicase Cas3
MTISKPDIPWAKLLRDEQTGAVVGWHSLVDHSADVAAVFQAIINLPTITSRLARLADRNDLPDIWRARLAALVALHDFGKANLGFQARWRQNARPIGHIAEALTLLSDKYRQDTLFRTLPLNDVAAWGEFPQSLFAILAHHGRPLDVHYPRADDGQNWGAMNDHGPVQSLAGLGQAVKRWFPEAFSPGGPPLPDAPQFWHAVAGLVMLADWLGSDTSFFEFADGASPDRMAEVRVTAPKALRAVGFDPAPVRATLLSTPTFASISKHPPRHAQSATGETDGQIVVLESETGSGKTEAALFRFARLFGAGEVDGLYFALPTRVAATSLYERVRNARDRMFPDRARRPGVVLAVPGYLRFDGIEGHPLPDFGVQWTDDPEEAVRASRWAAERPKRFLCGTIAVGTIDQALMGAIRVKHAHLRASSLLRHLLVVDEVHASDRYMAHLLTCLLAFHKAAGGHALLLSATLGAAARARCLTHESANVPPLTEAIAYAYPALSSDLAPTPEGLAENGRGKTVAITLATEIGDPRLIAARALAAAESGAKVLVVRNTRGDAVRTFASLMERVPNHPVLFRCVGVATLHHGRFAQEDRELLDAEVTSQMGSERCAGGLIVIGTQTLEQSLDIDADFLITDICPADVLLQRLGRLHRHPWRKHRPTEFEAPRAIILALERMDALLYHGQHGLGGPNGPYDDLIATEATRRLILHHPVWSIPAMNRLLVESATHPESLEELTQELEQTDPKWRNAATGTDGRTFAQIGAAATARLRVDVVWTDPDIVFPKDENFFTRLGLRDLTLTFDGAGPMGPFGRRVKHLAVPDYWLRARNNMESDVDPGGDVAPRNIVESSAGFTFTVQGRSFVYTATGLDRSIQ